MRRHRVYEWNVYQQPPFYCKTLVFRISSRTKYATPFNFIYIYSIFKEQLPLNDTVM